MLMAQMKENGKFLPFQSNLYEDLPINDNETFIQNKNMDNSIKGYASPGRIQPVIIIH